MLSSAPLSQCANLPSNKEMQGIPVKYETFVCLCIGVGVEVRTAVQRQSLPEHRKHIRKTELRSSSRPAGSNSRVAFLVLPSVPL